jgi:hypothetical protein
MKLRSLQLDLMDGDTLIQVVRHGDGTIEACGVFTPISRKQERTAKRFFEVIETEAKRQST